VGSTATDPENSPRCWKKWTPRANDEFRI